MNFNQSKIYFEWHILNTETLTVSLVKKSQETHIEWVTITKWFLINFVIFTKNVPILQLIDLLESTIPLKSNNRELIFLFSQMISDRIFSCLDRTLIYVITNISKTLLGVFLL